MPSAPTQRKPSTRNSSPSTRAAATPRLSHSQAYAVMQNAPINIILADTDLRITYLNPSSEKTLKQIEHLLPVKVEEIVGKSVDLFHKNPAYQRGLLANYQALPRRATIQLGPDLRRGVSELDGEGEAVGGVLILRSGKNAREAIAAPR